MKKRAIIFDCWDTVIQYIEQDGGNKLAYRKCFERLSNPRQVTYEEYAELRHTIFAQYFSQRKYEVSMEALFSFVFETLGLETPGTIEEMERYYVDNAYAPIQMPGIIKFLEYCHNCGLEVAVASNTILSELNTKYFIEKLIPNHPFKYILASSRVAVKKPNPLFFKLAAGKLNLQPEECYYLGDTFDADALGSWKAGLTPIWLNWKNGEPIQGLVPEMMKDGLIIASSYDDVIGQLEKRK